MSLESIRDFRGGSLLILLSTGIFFLGLFNNCSNFDNTSKLAYMTPQEAQSYYGKLIAPHYNKYTCENVDLYSCDIYVFSPDVEDGSEAVEFPCLDLSSGASACPKGTLYSYSTKDAIANCQDCSAEESEKRYQSQEVLCYHKSVMIDNHYPIRALAANYEDALEQTVKACEGMVEGDPL